MYNTLSGRMETDHMSVYSMPKNIFSYHSSGAVALMFFAIVLAVVLCCSVCGGRHNAMDVAGGRDCKYTQNIHHTSKLRGKT